MLNLKINENSTEKRKKSRKLSILFTHFNNSSSHFALFNKFAQNPAKNHWNYANTHPPCQLVMWLFAIVQHSMIKYEIYRVTFFSAARILIVNKSSESCLACACDWRRAARLIWHGICHLSFMLTQSIDSKCYNLNAWKFVKIQTQFGFLYLLLHHHHHRCHRSTAPHSLSISLSADDIFD